LRGHGKRSFFFIGVATTEPIRAAITACLDWQPAVDASLHDGAEIAEVTRLVDMFGYPNGND
jgi:hypothetical protein